MAQKPVAMEQLKQVRQLQEDGIPIREIARRVGISRNSVRKYLPRLRATNSSSNRDLAEAAYNNDFLEVEAERQRQVTDYFIHTRKELSTTGVTPLQEPNCFFDPVLLYNFNSANEECFLAAFKTSSFNFHNINSSFIDLRLPISSVTIISESFRPLTIRFRCIGLNTFSL